MRPHQPTFCSNSYFQEQPALPSVGGDLASSRQPASAPVRADFLRGHWIKLAGARREHDATRGGALVHPETEGGGSEVLHLPPPAFPQPRHDSRKFSRLFFAARSGSERDGQNRSTTPKQRLRKLKYAPAHSKS